MVACTEVGAVETGVERFEIYFGGRADQTGDGLSVGNEGKRGSKITSRSLANPWLDPIKQITYNQSLPVVIDVGRGKILRRKLGSLAAGSDPV